MRAPLVRELQADLRRLGFRVRRMAAGSHEVWESPGGRAVVLNVNHRSREANPIVLQKVRQIIREEKL